MPLKYKIKELQSKAIEVAMDGIALLDENGVYYFLNESHVKLFGYEKAEELIGKTWDVIYPDYEIDRLKSLIFPELIKNKKWSGETLGIRKDGVLVNQEITLTALDDGGLICVCRIIDDRKKMEEALKIFTERLSAVINSIDNGILLETYDRKVVMANSKLCDFFEINAEPSSLIGGCCKQSLEYTKTLTKHPKKFLKDIDSCIQNGVSVINDIVRMKNGNKSVHQLVAMAFLGHVPCGHKIVVDHINHDKLNNRLENLQLITNRENCSKDVKNKSSKYTGVSWDKARNKWVSQIKINGKTVPLGRYKCELVASIVYQKKLYLLKN